MSQSFRPVKEIWNIHSSCFVESEELIALLHDVAARVGTASDEHEYGDNKAIWLEDGTKVLGTILNDWDPKSSPHGYYGYNEKYNHRYGGYYHHR